MRRIYEVCIRCMDEPVERKQPPEDQESVNYCPKCGHKLDWALVGDKMDDTAYKIILNDTFYLTDYNKRIRFLEILKKMGNFSFNETLEKYKTKDSVIFEGDIKDVYLNMHLLDEFTPDIHYKVVPELPFARFHTPFISICPACGSDTIHKTVDVSPDYVHEGFFCETCNEWVLYTSKPKDDLLML